MRQAEQGRPRPAIRAFALTSRTTYWGSSDTKGGARLSTSGLGRAGEQPSQWEPRSPTTPRVEGAGRTVLACPPPAASAPPTNPAPESTHGRRLIQSADFVGSVVRPGALLACHGVHRPPGPRAGQTARPGIQEGTHAMPRHADSPGWGDDRALRPVEHERIDRGLEGTTAQHAGSTTTTPPRRPACLSRPNTKRPPPRSAPSRSAFPKRSWPTFGGASPRRAGPPRSSSRMARRACSWRRCRRWRATGRPSTTGAGARPS